MMNQLSRFKGCLIGALIGDCFGAAYEFQPKSSSRESVNRMKSIISGNIPDDDRVLKFTDDSAMMIALCESLLTENKLDQQHLAKTFTQHYFKEPFRGYGLGVRDVFTSLRDSDYADVLKPAESQFEGSGSFGNGGAMRVAPISLFAEKKDDYDLIKLATDATLVTHSNALGIAGAVLQSLAVSLALHRSPPLNCVQFLQDLRDKISGIQGSDTYLEQLDKMQDLFQADDHAVDIKWIVKNFGHDVSAHKSVMSAIYSFLRSLQPVTNIEIENCFARCILLAVSLGGDTDTIACMAGAISGAYFGIDGIPANLVSVCEGHEKVENFATDLFNIT